MKIMSRWLFDCDPQSAVGAISTQRPSADAMSALTFWEAGTRPRSDEVPVDEDALINAVLRPEEPDDDAGIARKSQRPSRQTGERIDRQSASLFELVGMSQYVDGYLLCLVATRRTGMFSIAGRALCQGKANVRKPKGP
jgi:hypothetical protein